MSIDALTNGKPVFCFEKACGIADIYKDEEELHSALVADYLDVESMAKLILEVALDEQNYNKISSKCKELAKKRFNMENYVKEIVKFQKSAY